MSKSFAVLLRGIHYNINYKDGIDYKKSITNFFENVIDPLKEIGNVDIYISTYISDNIEQMLTDYKPVSYIINEFNECSRHDCISKGLGLIKKEYTNVIIYRFDIYLKMKITNLPNLNYEKLNIPFYSPGMHKGFHRLNDAFYIFPFEFLINIINIFEFAKEQKQTHNHFIKHFQKHGIDVNILINRSYNSHTNKETNPIYKNRLLKK